MAKTTPLCGLTVHSAMQRGVCVYVYVCEGGGGIDMWNEGWVIISDKNGFPKRF